VKSSFRSFFGISRKEVNGFLFLCLLLLFILFVPELMSFIRSDEVDQQAKDQAILDSLLVLLEEKSIPKERSAIQFTFNPNQITKDSLLLLGFSTTAANQIINYRNKGGEFRAAQDLYKIYSIDSAHLTGLLGYVSIPQRPVRQQTIKEPPVLKYRSSATRDEPIKDITPLPKFNINTADTAMLQTISGIGSVLSKRIVVFRDKLGGFVSSNQLYEVYNLDSAVVIKLLDRSYLDQEFTPQKIQINSTSEEQLKSHPYITNTQARLIIAYRNQHGDFKENADLLEVYLMDSTSLMRLEPYISWQ
jgi:competence protein ComEA